MLRRIFAGLVRLTAIFIVHTYFVARYFVVEQRRQSQTRDYAGGERKDTGLWCISAIWQSGSLSQNLIAAFEQLNDAGYNLVLVNNGPLSNDIVSTLLSHCHILLIKPHGGRDFASYQLATAWLHRQIPAQEIQQVVYCNDSVFIRPSRFAPFLARLREREAAYIGITGSAERSYHVPSWFFAVSGTLFHHPGFCEFWRRYRPYSDRTHVIRHGEIGISQALAKLDIHPEVLYTVSTGIDGCFKEGKLGLVRGATRLSSISLWEQLEPFVSSMGDSVSNSPAFQEIPVVTKEVFRRLLISRSDLENTMNFYNLFYTQYCDLPFLKKDLVYRGQYLTAQIEDMVGSWGGCDREHIPEVLGYFRSRSAMYWIGGIRGFLTRRGIL